MPLETDIDLELIFDLGLPMEMKCEHSQHNECQDEHSDNSGLTYVLVKSCGSGMIRPFCDTYISYVRRVNPPCATCGGPLMEHYEFLGPVE